MQSLSTLHPEFLRGSRRRAELPTRFFTAGLTLFGLALLPALILGWLAHPLYWIAQTATVVIVAGVGAGILWNFGCRWKRRRRAL